MLLFVMLISAALANYPETLANGNADGAPMIPYTAEVAFVSAYDVRFFDNKMGCSPSMEQCRRVIDGTLYNSLGI